MQDNGSYTPSVSDLHSRCSVRSPSRPVIIRGEFSPLRLRSRAFDITILVIITIAVCALSSGMLRWRSCVPKAVSCAGPCISLGCYLVARDGQQRSPRRESNVCASVSESDARDYTVQYVRTVHCTCTRMCCSTCIVPSSSY